MLECLKSAQTNQHVFKIRYCSHNYSELQVRILPIVL